MKIFYIPDTQVRKDVPLEHLEAAGNYIVDKKPDVIVHAGDHWDMPSLSVFTKKGTADWEGLRFNEDIEAGKEGMEVLLKPLWKEQSRLRSGHRARYNPRMVYTTGNHDPSVRVKRFTDADPRLKGFMSGDEAQIPSFGWEEYPFLDIVKIGGIAFSHYFSNPHSAINSPLGGMIDTQLKNCGFSFVKGHTQGLKMGKHYLADGTCRLGISAGSFYQHDEDYMGPQGNRHWRGCIMLNEVENGGADVCELSLNYLMRNWL